MVQMCTMNFVRRKGRGHIAVLTATLMLPSLARGDSLAEPPAGETGVDAPAGDAAGAAGAADAADAGDAETPADVINPDLAAEAPKPDWVREGYGTGTGVAGPDTDPRVLNRKIRRAGKVTLAGGGIAVLGGLLAISGAVLLFGVRPSTRLNKLADENMGTLPVNDDKRHRLITIAQAGPIVAYAGLGVLVSGVIIAAVGRIRLKKLREQRRTSSVAFMPTFGPTTLGRGAQVQWEVRF